MACFANKIIVCFILGFWRPLIIYVLVLQEHFEGTFSLFPYATPKMEEAGSFKTVVNTCGTALYYTQLKILK
jgi:hypothetical protein